MSSQLDPTQQSQTGDDGELHHGKFCIQCGAVNSLRANYCSNCGGTFDEDTTTPPVVSVTTKDLPNTFKADEQRDHVSRARSHTKNDSDNGRIVPEPFNKPLDRDWVSWNKSGQFPNFIADLIIDVFALLNKGIVRLFGPKWSAVFRVACAIVFLSPLCIMLFQSFMRSYYASIPFPTPIRPAAVKTNPAQLKDTSTKLVIKETLPSEADSKCLGQMPKNQPLIAANFSIPSGNTQTTQGVALVSIDGIWTCRLTFPGRSKLEPASNDPTFDLEPRWISNNRIAFNSGRISHFSQWQYDVYTVDVDGSHLQHLNLSRNTGNNSDNSDLMFYDPMWSPDGKTIAFVSHSDFRINDEVYAVNSDGTGLRQLTDGADNVRELVWSPDSQWIFFTSTKDNRRQLYRLAADGSELASLSGKNYEPISSTSSPDGSSVAVIAWVEQNKFELSVMNPDGTNRRKLSRKDNFSDLTLQANPPIWLPDGKEILFVVGNSWNYSSIYKIRPDGSGLEKLDTNAQNLTAFAPSPFPIGVPEKPVIAEQTSSRRRDYNN